jgi:uncharacterized membrane protein
MIHMKGEVVVNRPVETVFDFVADACNEPHYNPHILRAEKISSGPIGLRTRFRNETASMGRTTEWTIEITSYDRPRQLSTYLRSSAMDIQGAMTFDSVGAGTRMQWSWILKPRGAFRLFAPLIGRLGQRLEDRNWQNMKHHLEAQETLPQ